MTPPSRRVLNRALLQRQFLLERTGQPPMNVIRHLVALQAQEPNWPYLGLWSRIRGFTHAHLTALLNERQVVRSGLLRSTQHLAAADDFRRLRPLLQPVLDRTANSAYFRRNGNNILLGHADRSRIIDDDDRKQVMPGRALVRPTILIDGFVRGTWSFTGDDIRLAPFRPLAAADREAVEKEAHRMLPFVAYRGAAQP
ncbi:DNA glycosylase AlkZ-like family protein [Hamadaea tsunoensis]|uniref:DNA glycosylase AlkZ-like family protein n=1 Tax=Hamadaea tsunoensis TaxID=53368 RepID=UPI000401573D|nr:crosslink repair DNA glycosylase YcaQ family protein [Hamadaea tsunoensis]